MTAEVVDIEDDRFGLCPTCHHTDGYVNDGAAHYFVCDTHRVRWFIGTNLFSNHQDETNADSLADQKTLAAYAEVPPYHRPRKSA